ncbi:MAG: hypothetical protein JWQ33_3150 [Ramlibacter sp.]|nr:hypothetical protein [Ramlibacter sp.]
MGTRMVTLHLDPARADLASVRARHSLEPREVDANFGVVSVSPERNLYAILVDEEAADRIEGSEGIVGTFSNPTVEAFGLPKKTR